MRKIFLIAGEASGDALGAKLMAALKAKSDELEFHGIGGERMIEAGLKPLYHIRDLSVMGFAEILPHIPRLLKMIKHTVEVIEAMKPDALITIDAPAFNHRIAARLKDHEYKGLMIHYVAPSVWAYQPGRAAEMAELYHHLLALLPFEPPYFEEEGLKTSFVGHPVVEEKLGNSEAFYTASSFSPEKPLLTLMPGSRKGELQRMMPVFYQTVRILQGQIRYLQTAILTPSHLHQAVEKMSEKWQLTAPPFIVSDLEMKKNALAASHIALVKSGTGTLEVALAGVPMAVAYKVNPISAAIAKRVLKVKFASIVNLIENKEVVKEFLQQNCTPQKIAPELERLYIKEDIRHSQLEQAHAALVTLGLGELPTPSEKAAGVMWELMQKFSKPINSENATTEGF